MIIARIIVDISIEKLDRPFDYIVPEELEDSVKVGSQVVIPFGKGNRTITGYVIELTDHSDFALDKLKKITSLQEKAVSAEGQLINLAYWIKENYGATMNKALKTVLPVKKKVAKNEIKTVVLNIPIQDVDEKLEAYAKKNAKARIRLLEELKTNPSILKSIVEDKLNISSSTLKTMEKLGDIRIESVVNYRNPMDVSDDKEYDIVLNKQQQEVSDAIKQTMGLPQTDKPNIHLIHGITGSGKTEVYIDLIAHAIEQGKQAIVLIPEIALTYQTVKRFTRKFKDRIAIINSKLSNGERYDQFLRAKNGDVDIMIGPRSALFTPFSNLGLIVIDEEHESSYKSETVPKYDAIEVATKRAYDNNATVVLGSATPSVESYYRAQTGFYKLHELTYREKGELPSVSIVDLREELKEGNKTIFSAKLKQLIEDRLTQKQQTMLFINRRGLAGFVSCRECGEVLKCPHCDVSLKLHKGRLLKCHYCGYETQLPTACPKCGSKYLGRFGMGTQLIEREIKQLFPEARVLRMDADTTSKKGSNNEILSAFANNEADILVGTQMIVKGHDFPNVTLVGVLAADMSLNEQDYKAAERTFQLICQAAGRAGRGGEKGDVVVQSYNPDNYSIVTSCEQDYKAFYEQEIAFRELLAYPPQTNLVCIMLQDKNQKYVDEAMNLVVTLARKVKENKYKELMIIGPTDPPVARVNDIYRKVLYLKSTSRTNLVNLKNYLEQATTNHPSMRDVSMQFDFKA